MKRPFGAHSESDPQCEGYSLLLNLVENPALILLAICIMLEEEVLFVATAVMAGVLLNTVVCKCSKSCLTRLIDH